MTGITRTGTRTTAAGRLILAIGLLAAFTATTAITAPAPVRAAGAEAAKGAATAAAPTLNIGDPAPPLKPVKWLKGAPIPAFEKGKVYVVEFWATWCGPCKANIPHLTEMAKKYRNRAEIIGVDIWESSDPAIKTLPRVEKFVRDQGAKMDYHVAADGADNRIADAWMKAANLSGIPAAFIIGKDGRIAWIGNPATGMDDALAQVVAGTFDVAGARARRDRQTGPGQAIDDAFAAKDYVGALKLIDALIASNPAMEGAHGYNRLRALAHVDLPQFKTRARGTLKETSGDIGIYQMLCSIPASERGLSPDAYRFGRSLVDEALAKKEREYLFLAMAAAIDTSLGDKDGAVRAQAAAVKAASTDKNCPPEFLESLKNTLVRLQAAARS